MITDPRINTAIVNNIEKFVEHANKLNTELVSIVFNDIDIDTYQLDKNILMYAQSNIANIAKNFSLLRNNVLVLTDLTIVRDKAIKFIMDNKEYYPNIDTSINVINTIAESVFYHNNDRLYTEAKIATTSIEAKYTIDLNRINKLKEEESNKNKAIELIKAFSDLSPTLNDSAKKVIAGEIVSFITELKENSNSDYEAVLEVLKNPPVESKKEEVIPKEDLPVKIQYKSKIESLFNYIKDNSGIARWKAIEQFDKIHLICNEPMIATYVCILIRRKLIKVIKQDGKNDTLEAISDTYLTETAFKENHYKDIQNKKNMLKVI